MAGEPAETLIGGRYTVGTSPAPFVAASLGALTCTDRTTDTVVMALRVDPFAPPRARALLALGGRAHPGVLAPLEYGTSGGRAFVVCEAAPGAPLSERRRPWSEADLLRLVLRPAAAALALLAGRQVTHRAIRLENVFRGAGGSAVLGPAWSAPPASLQPAVYEPPYVAACHPAGRGEGSIADDVYALGVVLVALALDRLPMEGLDAAAVIGRKLQLGSHAAIVGDARLPPVIAELAYGMLAEDPEHRPSPALLLDMGAARGRRVAAAPPRRAAVPLVVGERQASTARGLAHVLAADPTAAIRALRSGAVETWLRQELQDASLLSRVDATRRSRTGGRSPLAAEPMLLMRTVAILDPLAPPCWRDLSFWPDGIAGLAARSRDPAAPPALSAAIEEMVAAEATLVWAETRGGTPPPQLRHEARDTRAILSTRGPAWGLERLAYALNPLMPCLSPLLSGQGVTRVAELLPALEAAAARADRSRPPLDRHMAAFLGAREESRQESELAGRIEAPAPSGVSGQLLVLAGLQGRMGPATLPALAAWLVECGLAAPEGWNGRSGRERVTKRLAELVGLGDLRQILALLEDPDGRARDRAGLAEARGRVALVDAELARLAAQGPARAEAARRLGHEVAAGLGVLAGALVTVLMVLA